MAAGFGEISPLTLAFMAVLHWGASGTCADMNVPLSAADRRFLQ